MNEKPIEGCLIGTAVGDALGLPYEGLSPRRAKKLFGPPTRHRFLFGRGMVSDDTEHTVLVAESLMTSAGDIVTFEKTFANRLRRWFLTLPAGMGMATAKACIKLLLGVSAQNSGVFSGGNGPAMRSAILGVYAQDEKQLIELVRATTRITHTDPKAELGAFAVALAAFSAKTDEQIAPRDYLHKLKSTLSLEETDEFLQLIEQAVDYAESGTSSIEFAQTLGLNRGVGGYVFHCIPVVIHCWLTHQQDFESAMHEIIACGGDADTNAAMLGGIIGAHVGTDGIPPRWIDRLWLFPLSRKTFTQLNTGLDTSIKTRKPSNPPTQFYGLSLLRNLFFMLVVLFYGFRRLAPPY